MHIQDIATSVADDGRDPSEKSWPVLDRDGKALDAAFARELSQDHVGEQPHVDIAASQHQTDLLAGEQFAVGEHGRQGRCSGALDDDLLDFEQEPSAPHRLADSAANEHATLVEAACAPLWSTRSRSL